MMSFERVQIKSFVSNFSNKVFFFLVFICKKRKKNDVAFDKSRLELNNITTTTGGKIASPELQTNKTKRKSDTTNDVRTKMSV